MLARLERHLRLGLAAPEVQVIEVVGDRLIKRRQIGVDQEMMMTRIGAIRPRRRHTHVLEAKINGEFRRNGRAVLKVIKIDLRSWRDGVGPPVSGTLT